MVYAIWDLPNVSDSAAHRTPDRMRRRLIGADCWASSIQVVVDIRAAITCRSARLARHRVVSVMVAL